MYHPPSKSKQLIQRTVTYGLMSVAVVALVVVLIFVMLGYQFNRSDGRIEQGGLVQFDSKPNGANVTIDGANFGTRTPSKTTMTSGQHFVTIGRSGYKTWQKSVAVVPGSVLWLNYARLIPNDLKPSNVTDFPTVSSTAASPDAKWMAIAEDPASATFQLADLTNDQVKTKPLTIPANLYTHPAEGKGQAFTLVDWDQNSRYLLVKHTYNDEKIEWIVVDSQDSLQTKNVTKLLDVEASKVIFSGNNSRILYAQIGTDVRKIDLDAATLSRPLVAGVAEFSLYDDSTIVYATTLNSDTKTRAVGYYADGADKVHTIRSYADNGTLPLHLAVGKYFGDTYEAIAYGDTIEVLQGALPNSDSANPSSALETLATMHMDGGAQHISIITEGRFVVAQNGATYQVYDLELKKATATTLKGNAPVTDSLHWLDGYTVWSDRDGTLRLSEFDGANQHDIMPVTPGFSVTLSSNSKYIYGIGKSDNGTFHLERVRLILQ